jgi:hypothetical protein
MPRAEAFALTLQETLDMNGWGILTPDERAASRCDFQREHIEICGFVLRRLADLTRYAGRALPAHLGSKA